MNKIFAGFHLVLLVILGSLAAGCGLLEANGGRGFEWAGEDGQYRDLLLDGVRRIRWAHAFDSSTEGRLQETYKPFLHVFDAKGEEPITKGSGGLYTHHRGIFIGWNRVGFEGKEYDFWHMKGAVQRHAAILEEAAGPDGARLRAEVHWLIQDSREPVIEEEREMTVRRGPGASALLLDFRITLKAPIREVLLDGDPEHGGFQFRAHNNVADADPSSPDKAVYLFPQEGIDPLKDMDLPWAAMRFGLRGKFHTVQFMNHPGNPKGTVFSAYRDYGRFGAFFRHAIAAGDTLTIRYRLLIQEGDFPPRCDLDSQLHEYLSDKRGLW